MVKIIRLNLRDGVVPLTMNSPFSRFTLARSRQTPSFQWEGLRSNAAFTVSPLVVVVARSGSRHSRLTRGRRQFWVIWQQAMLDAVPFARSWRKWQAEIFNRCI